MGRREYNFSYPCVSKYLWEKVIANPGKTVYLVAPCISIYTSISMLSMSLTFPNHTATQNTTGLLMVSTGSKLSWSTIWCKEGVSNEVKQNQKIEMNFLFVLVMTFMLLNKNTVEHCTGSCPDKASKTLKIPNTGDVCTSSRG